MQIIYYSHLASMTKTLTLFTVHLIFSQFCSMHAVQKILLIKHALLLAGHTVIKLRLQSISVIFFDAIYLKQLTALVNVLQKPFNDSPRAWLVALHPKITLQ